MSNFVYVYYDESNSGDMPMEEVKAAWMAWFQELGDKIVDAGNPFAPGGKAVEKRGVSTIENWPATGYTIVKADSLDDATEWAKGCPILKHSDTAAVRVYETLPM